ncbi:chromosome segregation ATPase [Clostridium acetobutylicum]|uniref:Uncharacterized protein n=1 Tax=Clostridium acetobutylicum (strain ATCC 824 / DSM 792 / JCM 1419 / IAM 19013 / LMG 5710 / NBRC 13948 / NRRL B-527 / VKM B-1787 / 2291 / W) TaxID=272562 RepID=Q97IR0_CLOAB|nr:MULTISPECIES: hypothetical protein [Clostridium]AAK79547.1 Hypothetical protein CA_C1580 [Clostridium acetobutylicum ATCC 824]ADZ20632.1 Conserved hypothetical protein [Clostridium acetobutylicum EA 2018]AEI31879.1 hypothetical protein SMB_G1605 [Clostridium acetobutylicum DSM 1731]AWV81210.1 hypothetical protein DK921_14140 [Clostridium acetobutylicum]MBC2392841.1 hypothetical protein [Clostridium acetobutylicum]
MIAAISFSQSFSHSRHDGKTKTNIKENLCDNIKIYGQMDKEIQELQNQKEKVQQNREKLFKKALERGESQQDIQVELQGVDKQIEEIDKQISEVQMQKQNESLEKNSESKENSKVNDNDSKDDDSSKELIQDGCSLDKAKTIFSRKIKNTGEANTLKYEVEEDKARRVNTKYKEQRIDTLESAGQKLDKDLKNELDKIKKNKSNSRAYRKHALKSYKKNIKEDYNKQLICKSA